MTLGFGVYPGLILALFMALIGGIWIGPQAFINNSQKAILKPDFLLFLTTLGLFFACYRGFYVPYHPEILVMPWSYFRVLFSLSFFTIIWVSFFDDDLDLIEFIWSFCLGSLLFCLATIGLAIFLQKPPFYGAIIDIRYIPLGIKKFINTPGIANLLCLFPTTFLAAFLLKPYQRPDSFWTFGILGYTLSLIAAATIAQRSYFAIALIISPFITALFLMLLGSWRAFIAITITLLVGYPTFRVLNQEIATTFLNRPIDQSILSDSRFQILQYWVQNIITAPFQRVAVGPAPWDSLQWFHNFFADIHRLSGFWALLAAVILVAYIFVRILCVMRRDKRFGLFLMAIFIPCFLIMNTSVVPEGERQPFLLLLALGAIAEVVLARDKKQSPLSGEDLHPG